MGLEYSFGNIYPNKPNMVGQVFKVTDSNPEQIKKYWADMKPLMAEAGDVIKEEIQFAIAASKEMKQKRPVGRPPKAVKE